MNEKNKTCPKCNHFPVCKIIASFSNSLKKHRKIFKPAEDSKGPTEKLYSIVAQECIYYEC